MEKYIKIQMILILIVLSSCAQKSTIDKGKVIEVQQVIPKANIEELEMEVNNGGFNQYFINSSGENCYETLRFLKTNGKVKTAILLERAINIINPNQIPEKVFVEKLRKNEVQELYDEKIDVELSKLDSEFYKLTE